MAQSTSRKLEENFTENRILFLENFQQQEFSKSAQFIFRRDADNLTHKKAFHFHNVTALSETLNPEYDPTVIESLIGLDEYLKDGIYQYVIHTDEREFVVDTKTKVEIIELQC